MNRIAALKTVNDDFQVEYEVLSPIDISTITNQTRREIELALNDVNKQISLCEDKIATLNAEIDKLTNHADGLDYIVAVASGILTGLIDSFFVGELDLSECHEFGSKVIEEKVKKLGNSDNLKKAIQNLEKRTKNFFPSDANIMDFGGARQHHLRDFAHHPTIVGLVCSLLTQFTGMCYGTNKAGVFVVVPVADKERLGDTIPKKVIYGTLYWFLHLVSDMAGSNQYAGGGTGIPGPLLAMAKELSALPFFKQLNKDGNKSVSVFISKLFNGTLFAERDATGKIIKESVIPLDLRTEIGILHKQAMPVIINECIVRSFYMIRRFGMELREHHVTKFSDLGHLNWSTIKPIGNRTVERMMTIATGTFTAVDIADAAIRGAINSGGNWAGFAKEFILRVNFVGIGRFAIAVGVDVGMGMKRNKLLNERIRVLSHEISLLNVKVYYRCAENYCAQIEMFEAEQNMWMAAQNAEQAITEAYLIARDSVELVVESLVNIQDDIKRVSSYRETIEEHNPGLIEDMLKKMKY